MAYDDSGPIAPGASYSLGEYTFTLQNVVSEDERILQAHISGPEGTAAKGITVPTGSQLESWYVEANETEATVYATIKGHGGGINAILVDCSIEVPRYPTVPQGSKMYISGITMGTDSRGRPITLMKFSPGADYVTQYNGRNYAANVSGSRDWCQATLTDDGWLFTGTTSSHSGANGIYAGIAYLFTQVPESTIDPSGQPITPTVKDGEYLIARFAIDIREADGGPDGDWDEPGDTGDPSYTLNVSVTGASSGSNSGIPLEPGQTGGYGCGGTGGNGGGGGAGASTVIIYDFATDKAGTVNQEATAQGHGTGGPGGKGGKGGDGCILIFY